MTDLPQPLTPADCNLRGLPFMPMMVAQVMQSETFGLSTGDEFKAAFTLWCASWMEVPAGSLPSDDRMLEFLSRAKAWKKVKSMALRGWILCSDGRLYHPVVAANALEAWDKRTDYREKEDNKSTRQQRWREQCKALSEQLRALGVVPPRGASLTKLQELLASHGVDDVETQTSTQSVSASTCVDGVEIGKTETVKRQLTTTKPDTPPQASTEVGSTQAEGVVPTRIGEICIFLRTFGINTSPNALAQHEWVAHPDATNDLLTTAVATAKVAKPNQAIHVNYLKPIIERLLNPPAPPKPKTDDWGWRKSNGGIDAKGRELGMFARGGETYPDFANRIQQAIDKSKGQQP